MKLPPILLVIIIKNISPLCIKQSGDNDLYLHYNNLLIHLCPRVFERYGAVEYQVVCCRFLIDIEVADALELQVIEWLRVGEELLNVALSKHGE